MVLFGKRCQKADDLQIFWPEKPQKQGKGQRYRKELDEIQGNIQKALGQKPFKMLCLSHKKGQSLFVGKLRVTGAQCLADKGRSSQRAGAGRTPQHPAERWPAESHDTKEGNQIPTPTQPGVGGLSERTHVLLPRANAVPAGRIVRFIQVSVPAQMAPSDAYK